MTKTPTAIAGALSAIAFLSAPAIGGEPAPVTRQVSAAPLPRLDPSHIAITPPGEIQWTGKEGEQKALLFGNPESPGPYAMLIRWGSGHFSKPHYHSRDRLVYIVSGKWWMSSSEEFDPAKTVPVEAGSFVVQKAGTVHWDGAQNEPCVLLLTGEGPVSTIWLELQHP